jgi:hypothetical protein
MLISFFNPMSHNSKYYDKKLPKSAPKGCSTLQSFGFKLSSTSDTEMEENTNESLIMTSVSVNESVEVIIEAFESKYGRRKTLPPTDIACT